MYPTKAVENCAKCESLWVPCEYHRGYEDGWVAALAEHDEVLVHEQHAENARLCERAEALEAELAKARTSETITMWRGAAALERAGFTVTGLDAEVKRLEQQAEALAAALETVLYYAETYTVARFERGKVADARAALRAYREGGCPGCSFRRQTGGNHDDVPTGDADPNCPYREGS